MKAPENKALRPAKRIKDTPLFFALPVLQSASKDKKKCCKKHKEGKQCKRCPLLD